MWQKIWPCLTVDDIITGNRLEIYKKITSPFIANEDTPSGSDLLYIMVYKHNCELLIGSTATEVFFNSDSYFYTIPSAHNTVKDDVPLNCDATQLNEPYLQIKKTGVYDLIYPVLTGSQKIGYVRVGISGQRYANKFSAIMKKALVALVVILIVGLLSVRSSLSASPNRSCSSAMPRKS